MNNPNFVMEVYIGDNMAMLLVDNMMELGIEADMSLNSRNKVRVQFSSPEDMTLFKTMGKVQYVLGGGNVFGLSCGYRGKGYYFRNKG